MSGRGEKMRSGEGHSWWWPDLTLHKRETLSLFHHSGLRSGGVYNWCCPWIYSTTAGAGFDLLQVLPLEMLHGAACDPPSVGRWYHCTNMSCWRYYPFLSPRPGYFSYIKYHNTFLYLIPSHFRLSNTETALYVWQRRRTYATWKQQALPVPSIAVSTGISAICPRKSPNHGHCPRALRAMFARVDAALGTYPSNLVQIRAPVLELSGFEIFFDTIKKRENLSKTHLSYQSAQNLINYCPCSIDYVCKIPWRCNKFFLRYSASCDVYLFNFFWPWPLTFDSKRKLSYEYF